MQFNEPLEVPSPWVKVVYASNKKRQFKIFFCFSFESIWMRFSQYSLAAAADLAAKCFTCVMETITVNVIIIVKDFRI